jgi:hypothetical protein
MRVWQPGSHLMHQRGAEVDDWSWRRTRRRLGMLVRFTRPYRTRTLFSIGSLLLATAFALAPTASASTTSASSGGSSAPSCSPDC